MSGPIDPIGSFDPAVDSLEKAVECLDAHWTPRLLDLAARIRVAARTALASALRAANCVGETENGTAEWMRPHGQGAGDVTFAIDLPAERVLTEWLAEVARAEPVSLLTEDAGWRHAGPDGRGGVRELDGFVHGGPRIVVDPIDGTRNLMADLRAAWTVIGVCAAGDDAPRQRDVVLGVLTEIPDSRARLAREMCAARGRGARMRTRELVADGDVSFERLRCDANERADHGYFPFFRYMPDTRPAIARIEADFFARLERDEGADARSCYDDQYISNGGQLALLALGSYRMIADLRAHIGLRRGVPTLTSKPYDIAGALLVASEVGCVVTAADGSVLDFPLDATTPVGFVGWHNPATRVRLERHLRAALDVP